MKECPVNCNDETIVNAFLKNTRNKLKKKSVILGKLIIAWFATVFLGALLFLYIEQCARPTPKTFSGVERAWMKTCKMAFNLSNQISEINSSHVGFVTPKTAFNKSVSNLTTSSEFQKEIVRMCNETEVPEDVRRCVLDLNNIADYLDYTYSIAFTIGKLFL